MDKRKKIQWLIYLFLLGLLLLYLTGPAILVTESAVVAQLAVVRLLSPINDLIKKWEGNKRKSILYPRIPHLVLNI